MMSLQRLCDVRRANASRPFRLAGIASLCALLLVTGIGCQYQDRAARAIDNRWKAVGETLDIAVERERKAPAKMEDTIQIAAEGFERDIAKTERNAIELERLFLHEFSRWEKNQPIYRREIISILRGKPETLESTVIELFLE